MPMQPRPISETARPASVRWFMRSAYERERALLVEVVERALHLLEHLVVDLVEVGLRAEALAQVDRRADLQRDLRRQRHAAGQVADVDGERRGDRGRGEPQPGRPSGAQALSPGLAAGSEPDRER